MHRARTPRLALVLVAIALVVSAPRAANKRPITDTDLFKFIWIADPQISPDGTTVAFVRVVVNEKENRYETSLFVVPTSGNEEPRRITAGIRDSGPRWSPDGKRLAFVRNAEKDGKPQPSQIYLLPMDGGEARAVTNLPKAALSPAWSPDGKIVAFTTTTTAEDVKKAREEREKQDGQEKRDGQERREGPDGREHKSDVKVITRAVYRANGNSDFLEADRHSHIWTMAVSDDPRAKPAEPNAITTGD